jgi:uncharacterized membrane protein
LAYVLSYINVSIFWNSHHHMLHATERIDGLVPWANLLLFWLSLIPFVIRWMDESWPHPVSGCGLWVGAVNGSDRLQSVATRHHCCQRPHLPARRRDRP